MVESGGGSRYLSKTMFTASRIILAIFALAAIAGGLEGCARRGNPAPVTFGSGDGSRAAPPETVAPRGPVVGGGSAVVQPGETLYSIARRSGVPIRAIIDANGLQPPFILQPGQTIALPRVRTHQVVSGDTVYNIARRYGVSQSELVRANTIETPFTIQLGRVLVVPNADGSPPTDTASTLASVPTASRDADVTSGRPLQGPAQASPPPSAATAPVANDGGRPVRGIEAAPLPPQGNNPAAADIAASPPPPATGDASTSAAVATPAARVGRGFAWPVRGRVVSDFGPKPGGLHNDGLNIAAPRGTPFHAADNGVVVYAGNELRGFGNLILVRHDGGWVTAYAHAEEIAAQRGDQVRRGQVLGKVGQTGNVASPQLHFEIRRGTRAVDPRELLSGGAASG